MEFSMKKIDLRDSPFFEKHVKSLQPERAKKPKFEMPLNVAPFGQCCDGSGWFLLAVDYSHPDFGKLMKCACGRAGQPDYKMAKLAQDLKAYSHCTFETWNMERALEQFQFNGLNMGVDTQKSTINIATKKAKEYAMKPNGWLYIHGSYGAGKTHLAAAIGHVVASKGWGVTYKNMPELLDTLRKAIGEHRLDQELVAIIESDVLILDDMGVEEMTGEFMNARLWRIFDERMNKPTIITSNLDLSDLQNKVGGRIASRLLQSDKIFLPLSDFRKYKK